MRVFSLIAPNPKSHNSLKFPDIENFDLIWRMPKKSKPVLMARLAMRLVSLISGIECSGKLGNLHSPANKPPTKTRTLKPSDFV